MILLFLGTSSLKHTSTRNKFPDNVRRSSRCGGFGRRELSGTEGGKVVWKGGLERWFSPVQPTQPQIPPPLSLAVRSAHCGPRSPSKRAETPCKSQKGPTCRQLLPQSFWFQHIEKLSYKPLRPTKPCTPGEAGPLCSFRKHRESHPQQGWPGRAIPRREREEMQPVPRTPKPQAEKKAKYLLKVSSSAAKGENASEKEKKSTAAEPHLDPRGL